MNAVSPHTMFQSAYRQISHAERVFVDRLVQELHSAAKRHGEPVRRCLDQPLPPRLLQFDTRGFLARPLVCAAINEQVIERATADEISPQTTAQRIHLIAHAKISDYYSEDELGDIAVDMDKLLDPEISGAIKSVEFEKSDSLTRSSKTKIKITMHDAVAALKMELLLMGLDDGDGPYRKATDATSARRLAAGATAQEAGDAYASMIGDD